MRLSQNPCNSTCLTLQLHSTNWSTEILFRELSSLINLYHLFIYSVGNILSQLYLLIQSFLNNNFGCKTIGDIKPRGSKKSQSTEECYTFVGLISLRLLKSNTNLSLFLFQVTPKTLRYSGSFCLKMSPISI